jgi:RecQ-mediated genome instability protein 1
MATPFITQLTHALTTLGLPPPHPSFLTSILTSGPSQRLPPLPALTATAKLRLLNADLTAPHVVDTARTPCLPAHITDATVPARILPTDVTVQVREVEDIGRSRWEQIEALERERKGETAVGREVIRVVPVEGEEAAPAPAARSSGPFKLLMEDVKGQRVYGVELRRVEKVGYPPVMSIGCKMVLKKGTKVAMGMVLLEPAMVVVLGGKIEVLDKSWREGREQALRDAVGDGRRGAGAAGINAG